MIVDWATWHTNRAREEIDKARRALTDWAATPHAALAGLHLARARELLRR